MCNTFFRLVLRTGFDCEKGKLMRTVLYNNNTVKNTDGYKFIKLK